jgi:hypothetical protein
MGFVTPALLGGAILIGVPIVLHLVMRREPQKLVFPALRFVQRRRSANQTRLRLRHLLLLALRCVVITLLAFGLARPSIRGSGQTAGKNAPIAAALVFDNSLRMEYRQRNRTRLAEAQQLASWLLEQLPADTPTAVMLRSDLHRGFAVDRGAAQLKVSHLTASAVVRPLQETIRDAVELLREKEDYRPEIYVFTDLAESAWTGEALDAIRQSLDLLPCNLTAKCCRAGAGLKSRRRFTTRPTWTQNNWHAGIRSRYMSKTQTGSRRNAASKSLGPA